MESNPKVSHQISVDPASPNQNEASSTFFDINEIFSGDLEIDGIDDWGDDTNRTEEQKGAILNKIEESKEDEIDENILQVDCCSHRALHQAKSNFSADDLELYPPTSFSSQSNSKMIASQCISFS